MGGGGGRVGTLGPTPKSATKNIDYKPKFGVSVIFGIVIKCRLRSPLLLSYFIYFFISCGLPLTTITLFESLSRKHIRFDILVDCDSTIGL